jgi:hypothetical protein
LIYTIVFFGKAPYSRNTDNEHECDYEYESDFEYDNESEFEKV